MAEHIDKRPDWDSYFMQIAHVVKLRANCSRRMVAAVIVKDKRIIATGYNGTPRGIRNCFEGRCPRCSGTAPSGTALDECICSHAEENAIVQSAYHGISTKDSTIYVTLNPCLTCAKMIINAGIREVVYDEEYRFSDQTKALLAEAGVKCRKYLRGAEPAHQDGQRGAEPAHQDGQHGAEPTHQDGAGCCCHGGEAQ